MTPGLLIRYDTYSYSLKSGKRRFGTKRHRGESAGFNYGFKLIFGYFIYVFIVGVQVQHLLASLQNRFVESNGHGQLPQCHVQQNLSSHPWMQKQFSLNNTVVNQLQQSGTNFFSFIAIKFKSCTQQHTNDVNKLKYWEVETFTLLDGKEHPWNNCWFLNGYENVILNFYQWWIQETFIFSMSAILTDPTHNAVHQDHPSDLIFTKMWVFKGACFQVITVPANL